MYNSIFKTQLIIISLLFTFTMLAFAEPTLDEATAKLTSAWEKQKNIKADLSADASLPINDTYIKLKGIGELFIKRENDKDRVAQTLSAFPATLAQSGNSSLLNNPIAKATVIFDGTEFFVTYQFLGKQDTVKTSPDITKGAIPPGGKKLFEMVKEKMNIVLGPETEWDGKKMVNLKLEPKEAGGDVSSANVLMDPDFGMIRKLEIIGKDQTPLFACEFKNVKTDVEIQDAIFQIPVQSSPEPSPATPAASTSPNQAPTPQTK